MARSRPVTPLQKKIASRVRQLRRAAVLTQEQLAEQVGVSVETMSRYEQGRLGISVELLERIAEALRTAVGSLIEDRIDGLTPAEADLLARFRQLDDRGRTLMRHHLHYLTEPKR